MSQTVVKTNNEVIYYEPENISKTIEADAGP